MDSNKNVANSSKKVERAHTKDTKKKSKMAEPSPKPQVPKRVSIMENKLFLGSKECCKKGSKDPH